MHLVFTGNPGTGKTTVARLVGQIYKEIGLLEKGHVIEVDRSDLVGKHIGQTEDLTAAKIKEAVGGVLFIDEAYALVDGSRDDKRDFGNRVIDKLVSDAENLRDKMVIILAGYTGPMEEFLKSNPGLSSRFPRVINFPDYGEPELMQIMDLMADERGLIIHPSARAEISRLLTEDRRRAGGDFGNARAVRTLVETLESEMALRLDEEGVFSLPKEKKDKALFQTITVADVARASGTAMEAEAEARRQRRDAKGSSDYQDTRAGFTAPAAIPKDTGPTDPGANP
jgi:stage V sporulation protein K